MEKCVEEVLKNLEQLLEYRRKECEPSEWGNYSVYAKIISDLCTTIDTLKYYYDV